MAAVGVLAAAGCAGAQGAGGPEEGSGSPPAEALPVPLRTLEAPFTGSPRLVVLRDRPATTVSRRWLAAAAAQATAAGLSLTVDHSAVDAPTLGRALGPWVEDAATAALLVDVTYAHGVDGLADALARASARGVPVAAQTAHTPPHVPMVVRADDAQLVRDALNGVPPPAPGAPVGLVSTVGGYGDLDRRVAAWAAVRDERRWRQVLIDQSVTELVATDPDDGTTASMVRAAVKASDGVELVAATSAFLASATAVALRDAGRGAATQLVAVLDPEDDDVDLTPLAVSGGPECTCGVLDPAELGAAAVRAVALLLAGEAPGSLIEVPGQVVTTQDMAAVGATSTSRLVPHLSVLRGATPSGLDVATAEWLPAVST